MIVEQKELINAKHALELELEITSQQDIFHPNFQKHMSFDGSI